MLDEKKITFIKDADNTPTASFSAKSYFYSEVQFDEEKKEEILIDADTKNKMKLEEENSRIRDEEREKTMILSNEKMHHFHRKEKDNNDIIHRTNQSEVLNLENRSEAETHH